MPLNAKISWCFGLRNVFFLMQIYQSSFNVSGQKLDSGTEIARENYSGTIVKHA